VCFPVELLHQLLHAVEEGKKSLGKGSGLLSAQEKEAPAESGEKTIDATIN